MSQSTPGRTPLQRVAVLIPTYNEAENLEWIVGRVRAATPQVDVVVLDDNSPDGTGDIADRLAEGDDHIHVMHRTGKQGLGAAYLAGFEWGMDRGYGVLVSHDADGSHQPEELPRLLQAINEGADMVKGSRWVKGGSIVNWPASRVVISKAGSLWTRIWLGIPVKDATGGFNAYRATTLRGMNLNEVASAGYCFQIDLVWRAIKHGFKVVEVPIEFVEREFGDSKMSRNIVVEALLRTTLWGIEHRFNQLKNGVRKAIGRSRRQDA